ncbi:hypothetical protein UPYG_G00020050 [Umbra pygmaea]|uniref:Cysteine/serine-rich nuclear protein N-terminal domain-containing protein n=1 Tax=Umbra pygmaea TaxID=75934 RepID=A0ABD0XMQ9_UMBPY
MTGILKRKFEEVEVASPAPCLSLQGSDDDVSAGSDSGNSSDSVNPAPSNPLTPSSILRREKRMRGRNVHFESVTVYYFRRRQGFTSVPTQGGSTLGMSTRHSWVQHYTLGEFAVEQERSHRDMLRDHLKEEKLNSIKLKLTKNGTVESDKADSLTVDDISEGDIDLDNTEVDEYFFLQPLTTRRRRALLRASGVRRIDVEEKHELRAIRVSREECGCDCRGRCHPETCACSLAGIKCQVNGAVVDRMSFPCGCSKGGCSNSMGRIEFNPIRVRTHFLHTIMKLELEKSHEQQQLQVGNSYRREPPVSATAQHALQYAVTSDPIAVPQAPIMHLPNASETDQLVEEEEDEEEDEEEEEEEYDEEDDGSSLCSGLSDCSTHSLNTSDSEDEEDSEEEDWESMEEGESRPTVVPLSSDLGYPNGPHHNPDRINSCYHSPLSRSYQTPTSLSTDGLIVLSLEQPESSSMPQTDNFRQVEGGYLSTNQCFPHNDKAAAANACSSAPLQSNTAPSGETVTIHCELPCQPDVNGNDITLSLKHIARSKANMGMESPQSLLLPEKKLDSTNLENNSEIIVV